MMSNGLFGNLLSMLNGAFGGEDVYEGGLSLDQIIQQIIENDPNRYGPPPASKKAVEDLPKGKYEDFYPKDDATVIKEKEDNKS